MVREARNAAYADDAAPHLGEAGRAAPSRRGNVGLDRSACQCRPHPAGALDVLKQRPGSLAERTCQSFQTPRAGRRIINLGETSLVDQHAPDVAGKPARVVVRKAEG